MKPCSKCGDIKPLEEFHKQTRARDGRQNRCKECAKALARQWYSANRERATETRKRYAKQNPEKAVSSRRRVKLRNKYGMTLEEYDALVQRQGGVCAICHQPERIAWRDKLSIDHDHSTGAVRGLLCDDCNNAIRLFADDPVRIASGIRYLEESREGLHQLRGSEAS